MQLRFTSLAVTSLWRDFHPQECAHAGRTREKAIPRDGLFRTGWRRERCSGQVYLKEAMAPASSSLMSKTVYSLVNCSRS
jgi:hypothetical protein